MRLDLNQRANFDVVSQNINLNRLVDTIEKEIKLHESEIAEVSLFACQLYNDLQATVRYSDKAEIIPSVSLTQLQNWIKDKFIAINPAWGESRL